MDSAVLLCVPDVEPVVGPLRSAPGALDVPGRVVLVHPFVVGEQLDVGTEEELRWFFAGVDGFALQFSHLERAQDALWLVPEPQQEVADLASALARRWPGGATASAAPRLAVARDTDLDEVERALVPSLPLAVRLTGAALWVDDGSGWVERAHFPLAAGEPEGVDL